MPLRVDAHFAGQLRRRRVGGAVYEDIEGRHPATRGCPRATAGCRSRSPSSLWCSPVTAARVAQGGGLSRRRLRRLAADIAIRPPTWILWLADHLDDLAVLRRSWVVPRWSGTRWCTRHPGGQHPARRRRPGDRGGLAFGLPGSGLARQLRLLLSTSGSTVGTTRRRHLPGNAAEAGVSALTSPARLAGTRRLLHRRGRHARPARPSNPACIPAGPVRRGAVLAREAPPTSLQAG